MSFPNAAHIHLVLNTIPYIGFGFGILMMVAGWWRRKPDVVRFALLIFMVVAAITIFVYISGLAAQHVVHGLPDVHHDMIETHEESALLTLISFLVVGVLSGLGYYFHRRVRLIAPNFLRVLLVLAVIAEILVLRTSLFGGRINHPEVREGFVPAPATSQEGVPQTAPMDTLHPETESDHEH